MGLGDGNKMTLQLSPMMMDEDVEMIPIMGDDDENVKLKLPEKLPILPVRNMVLFPGVVVPITLNREKATKLVKKAYKGDRIIGVVAQSVQTNDEPTIDQIHTIGTIAKIVKLLVLPDGSNMVIIQGVQRFEIEEVISTDPYMIAKFKELPENFPKKLSKEEKGLMQSIKENALKILKLNPDIPREAQFALDNIKNNSFLIHFLASNLNVDIAEKQKLLTENDGITKANMLLEYMLKDIQMLEIKREIQQKASADMDQQQREFYLRQQLKVLHDELGNEGAEKNLEELKIKAKTKKWSKEVEEVFNKELLKLQRTNSMAPEYPNIVNYLEYLIDLPFNEYTKDNFNLKTAKKKLDVEHFGIEKIKERIIEYLAVLKLRQDLKAPIICLYGPPGVGKTSLAKSIASALGRKYVRMSLGGVHDEAEIRGHRRTYIGAMPGKVIQNIKKAQSANPVFVLDEIDKLGNTFRGDPSSALLEVLDPEQNTTFLDNYLDVEFDLSKTLFIATANSLDSIQPALRDRMEIIELSGYTIEEKVQIAKRHLLPKQLAEHGLTSDQVNFAESGLLKIAEEYTLESGVRNLERQIAKVLRKIAKLIASEEATKISITSENIKTYLGSELVDRDKYEIEEYAGVVTGLAWTAAGGDILMIESSLSKGKGRLILSGQLGDVMKESAQTALSHLRSQAESLGIDYRLFDQYDLHIHVPAGAVPKDGPSAGITMFTSIASAFTQRKIKERLAMSGEITLRGKVLPVGGIKEKVLAARRSGIREIILCKKNEKDVLEIDQKYLKEMKFHYVDHVTEVTEIALLKHKIKKPQNLDLIDLKKEI